MRGKPDLIPDCSRASRITPADAGKTFQNCREGVNVQDHPRGCGENSIGKDTECYAQGSPPRMRGKHIKNAKKIKDARITPADAGKTQVILPSSVRKRDHPRGCGENRL